MEVLLTLKLSHEILFPDVHTILFLLLYRMPAVTHGRSTGRRGTLQEHSSQGHTAGAVRAMGRPSRCRPARRMDRPARRMDRPARRMDRPARRMDRPVRRMDRPARRIDRPARRIDRPARRVDRPACFERDKFEVFILFFNFKFGLQYVWIRARKSRRFPRRT